MTKIAFHSLALFGALFGLAPAALAQTDYPIKPIRLTLPFPAGGSTDIVGRVVAQKLSGRLGQNLIVDKRGGAGGTIGTYVAAKARPDGYTPTIGTASTHAVATGAYSNGPADLALPGDEVQALFGSMPALPQHVKTGKLVPLAVGTAKRSPALPEVFTVAELGYPDFEVALWLGVRAAAGAPKPVIDRLQKELAAIVPTPEFKTAMEANGADPIRNTPDKFAKLIADDGAVYAKVDKTIGLKLD